MYIVAVVIHIAMACIDAVWKELEKENKEFFEAYAQSKSKDDRMSEEETSRVIQRMISQQSESESSKDHDPDE